jgi:hypothetical protein
VYDFNYRSSKQAKLKYNFNLGNEKRVNDKEETRERHGILFLDLALLLCMHVFMQTGFELWALHSIT